MPGTRKLGRTTAQRTAMLRAMVTFLLENGKIVGQGTHKELLENCVVYKEMADSQLEKTGVSG